MMSAEKRGRAGDPIFISQEVMEQADVVFGINKASGERTVFYGKSLLDLIASGYEGRAGLPLNILRVPIDFATDEPERLAAALFLVKGMHDAKNTTKPA
jgi:hypothetical protein